MQMKKIILVLMMMVSASFAFTFSTYYSHDSKIYEIQPSTVGFARICTYSVYQVGSIVFYPGSSFSQAIYRESDSSICSEQGRGGNGYQEYSAIYVLSNSCQPPNVVVDGQCVASQQCTENMKISSDGTYCVCKDGYNPDDVIYDDAGSITTINTCKPKKNCPPQMKYFWTDKATDIFGFQTDYYDCVPRTDLSDEECSNLGGTPMKWANDTSDGTSQEAKYMMMYGEGCVNSAFLADEAWSNNLSFIMGGALIGGVKPFPMSLAGKAVKPETLALEFKNAEAGTNLSNTKPEVIDLVMGSDGVYAEVGLTPKDASLDLDTMQTFNQWLKDNGLYGQTNKGYEYPSQPVNNLGVDEAVSSAMNNMYKGGDEVSFSDNILGAAKVADKADSFATMDESLNIGATKTFTIDLKSLLDNATSTKSYPVTTTVLDKSVSATGEVTTKTLSKINYPDGTYSNVTTLAQKFADATTKYDVTISTPISTTNGTKTLEQSYTVTKNASGQVTNTVATKSPTISYTDSSGHTTTASNTSTTTSTQNQDKNSPIDLTNIQNALNQMNKTLTETKSMIKDLIEYKPSNLTQFDTSLQNFKNGFTDFSIASKFFCKFIINFTLLFQIFPRNIFSLKPFSISVNSERY